MSQRRVKVEGLPLAIRAHKWGVSTRACHARPRRRLFGLREIGPSKRALEHRELHPISRDDLRRAYGRVFEGDEVRAGVMALDYWRARARGAR